MTGLTKSDMPDLPAFPAVRRTPDSEDFFSAAADGWVLLRRCIACATVRGPQVRWCPHCHEEDHETIRASGESRLVSWAVVHRPPLAQLEPDVPYVAGLVEVSEGPWLLLRVVTAPGEQLRAGTPVGLGVTVATDESEALIVAFTEAAARSRGPAV